MGNTYYERGQECRKRGDYDGAWDNYEKSLEVFEKLDNLSGKAKNYYGKGTILQARGHLRLALELYEKATVIFENRNEFKWLGIVYGQLGDVYGELNDQSESFAYLLLSYSILEQLGGEQKQEVLQRLVDMASANPDSWRAWLEDIVDDDEEHARHLEAVIQHKLTPGSVEEPTSFYNQIAQIRELYEQMGDRAFVDFCRKQGLPVPREILQFLRNE